MTARYDSMLIESMTVAWRGRRSSTVRDPAL
jgi:hypothetical protein